MLKKRLFPLVVVLSIALVAAIGLAFWQYQEAQASGLAVRAGRERAYYSALDALTNLETDLSKALIASTPGQHALLLGRVATLATAASENLSPAFWATPKPASPWTPTPTPREICKSVRRRSWAAS